MPEARTGDRPCVVLMVGARRAPKVVHPVSAPARRQARGTRSPDEAYAAFSWSVRGRPEGLALPWAG